MGNVLGQLSTVLGSISGVFRLALIPFLRRKKEISWELGSLLKHLESNLCVFDLQTSNETQKSAEKNHFFNVPAFLTVSGQLHLEVMAG